MQSSMLVHRERYVTEETIGEITSRWLEQLAGSKGRAPVAPIAHPLLVMMDLQNLFLDERSAAFLPAWPAVRSRCEALLAAFRAARRPVLWSRHVDPGDRCGRVVSHFGGKPIGPSDPMSELAPGFEPAPAEAVCVKSYYSAWSSPAFAVEVPGGSTLVLAGVTTHRCVLATAVDASSRDVLCIVAADATATLNERLHVSALEVLSSGFAHVASTAEILAALADSGRP